MASDSHSEHHHHVVPEKVFINVFFILVALTIVTVVVAKWRIWFAGQPIADLFDFGSYNILVSMFIASIKAVFVMLFFMHLKYEDRITWTYVVFPIFLIFVLMAGIAIDNPFRKGAPEGVVVEQSTAGYPGSDSHGAEGHGDYHHGDSGHGDSDHGGHH